MRKIILAVQLLALVGTAASAKPQPQPVPKLQIPAPPMNTAHTTPATTTPMTLLPQARQVNNPTGAVPNTYKFLAPPALPQAPQVKCVPSATKRC